MPNPAVPALVRRPLLAALSLALAIAGPVAAQSPAPRADTLSSPVQARGMDEIIKASAPTDWRTPEAGDTLYVELENGRVVIELAPDFAPEHVANIRALARGRYWDGLSINRSHDNFVVQWGDAAGEDGDRKPLGEAREKLPAEFVRQADGLDFHRLPDPDGWAPQVGFVDGFPAARHPGAGTAWLAHCYGMVGAGRGMEADSSNGTELYVVTGQSPRQLDRNITLVGRVLHGIERLSALPRGTGALGFYETAQERTPVRAIRLASDVPDAERTHLEVMRTDTPLFDELVEARRNRRDAWYKTPAGHIDLCNVPVPVRMASKDGARGE